MKQREKDKWKKRQKIKKKDKVLNTILGDLGGREN